MLVGIARLMMNGLIVNGVMGVGRIKAMENDINEYFKEINWRVVKHTHDSIYHYDTCPMCVMEQALYGGKD